MAEPVIFLAFANQSEHPLPRLSEEAESVYDAFTSLANADDFQIYRDQEVTARSMIANLGKYPGRISIFHFAGHAETAHLYLADQALQGPGLIQLLSLQKPLRLVFLNGCNTSGFISGLLNSGIPAVIATTRSVEDPLAVKLAQQFYHALTHGSTIGEAFAFAKGALEGDGSAQQGLIDRRGIKLPREPSTEFAWGLYYQDEKALDWRLAEAQNDVNPVPAGFWPRLALLVLILFAFYAWGNINIGYQNLALYFVIGPFALLSISSALLKVFGSRYPGIMAQIGRPLFAVLNVLLKPAVMIALLVVVTGLFAFTSSVRIDHPGNGPLEAGLLTPGGQPVGAWRIAPDDPDNTRLLTLSYPGRRHWLLHVNGYEDHSLAYQFARCLDIPLDSLQEPPALLLRLPAERFPLKTQLYLNISRNGNPVQGRAPFGESVAILLGRQHIKAATPMISRWKTELAGRSPALADRIVELWQAAVPDPLSVPVHYGDTLAIALMQGDSLLTQRIIEIQNHNFTDVLLQ